MITRVTSQAKEIGAAHGAWGVRNAGEIQMRRMTPTTKRKIFHVPVGATSSTLIDLLGPLSTLFDPRQYLV